MIASQSFGEGKDLKSEGRQSLEAASDGNSMATMEVDSGRHALEAAHQSGNTASIGAAGCSQGAVVSPSGQVVPDHPSWVRWLMFSPNIGQFGAGLVWGLARGFVFPGLDLLNQLVKPVATRVAFNTFKGLFPLPCSIDGFLMVDWPAGQFSADQRLEAWVSLSAAALNHLHGEKPPFPKQRGGVAVKIRLWRR